MSQTGSLRWVGRPVPRPDGLEKAAGATRFMTDLRFGHPVYGRVLRAAHPHARIVRLDVTRARALPGVVCVLTAADIPGLNAFGIIIQDQPVLAHDKVRMTGDAVALVAAESEEIAERALRLIEVVYEPLPAVTDPEAALMPGAPPIHPGGNLLQKTALRRGDVAAALARAAVVIERKYETPRQMHAFLETEGGWARYNPEDQTLTVWCPAQAAYRDRMQLARILGWNPARIRIVSSPIGGAFGGKDELTVQPYLALLALHTGGRPVRLHLKREESVVAGIKRHPFTIYMTTAADREGRLLAVQARLYLDKGAYASLGPAVLALAVEHTTGPYKVANVEVEGYAAYTNNGFCGAFRGFGVPQVCFALESNLDLMAETLGLDPIAIRKRNVFRRGEEDGAGHVVETSVGIYECLEALEQSDLWQRRAEIRAGAPIFPQGDAAPPPPHIRRGIGVAASLHGVGLGKGIPDYGQATLELLPGGRFGLYLAPQEIGQGNTAVYAQFAAEALMCDVAEVEVVQGDTARVPDGGTVTASRGTYAGGQATLKAAEAMVRLLKEAAAADLEAAVEDLELQPGQVAVRGVPGRAMRFGQIYDRLAQSGRPTRADGYFLLPQAERGIEGVMGAPHYVCGFAAHLCLVEVDTLTGEVRVPRVIAALDCGQVVNPLGLEGQSEGGVVMGLGYALLEDTVMRDGVHQTRNFATYILPTTWEAPAVETIAVESAEETGPYGAKGIGEVVMIPIVAAVPNAIADATGARVYRLPATPERVWRAMRDAGMEP